MNNSTWSVGASIIFPMFALVVAGLLIAAVLCLVLRPSKKKIRAAEEKRSDTYRLTSDRKDARWGAIWLTLLAILIGALTVLSMVPFDKDYHSWNSISGTVASVDVRGAGGSESHDDLYVIRLDDVESTLTCNSNQCASVKEGDSLTLACKRENIWAATDESRCKFVSAN